MIDTVGSRIKSLRVKYGLKQTDLAKKLGYSVDTVSNWETDKTIPKGDAIVDLAEYFGVTCDYILCG